VLLGNHQEVHGRTRVNVMEGEQFLVFIDLARRNLPFGDAAENAMGVVIVVVHGLLYLDSSVFQDALPCPWPMKPDKSSNGVKAPQGLSYILVESQRLFDAKVLAIELQPLLAALRPSSNSLRTMLCLAHLARGAKRLEHGAAIDAVHQHMLVALGSRRFCSSSLTTNSMALNSASKLALKVISFMRSMISRAVSGETSDSLGLICTSRISAPGLVDQRIQA
jgi:hypothetical protein